MATDLNIFAPVFVNAGAPDDCHVISENPELDGKRLPLDAALQQIVGFGYGTLVSCIPGRLAFFEGEGPSDRCILVKPAP